MNSEYYLRRICISFALLIALFAASVVGDERELFPLPETLQPAVEFWTQVYTEVETHSGYVHDSRKLNIVYTTLQFKSHSSPRQQKRAIARIIERYRKALKAVAAGKREDLSEDEKRVVQLWGASASRITLDRAAGDLRFQRGQADRFRDGVIRSGAWEKAILETLHKMGLPDEFAAIPHIESSYNPSVRSQVGATGLWQITQPSGREFIRIDHLVDERLDPLRSTMAAAAILKRNYSVLGSWPLAITAYNSGLSRVRKAVKKTGTSDIGIIVRDYRGPRFRFASRNFYPAFLAAVAISKDTATHFGPLKRDLPLDYQSAEIPAYLEAKVLAKALSVDQSLLKQLNPALRYPIWSGSKYIPKGYAFKFPSIEVSANLSATLDRIALAEGHERQIPDTFYVVQRGDTLSAIAQRFKINIRELVALNNLRSRHRIKAGQSLRLPEA